MEEKTYRYEKWTRVGNSFLFILCIIYLISNWLLLFPPRELFLWFSVGDHPFTPGLLFLKVFDLIVFWLFIGMARFSWNYRITLSNTGMRILSTDFLGRKFFNALNSAWLMGWLPYEEIMFVNADEWWRPGIAKFVFKDGRQIFLAVRALENYPDFVSQLAAKLDVMQVGQGFLRLGKPRRFKRLVTLLLAILMVVYASTLLYTTLDNTWEPPVWNTELTPWRVTSISKDADDSLWVSVGSSGLSKNNIYVWRLSEDTRDHWTFSPGECRSCRVRAVSHDARGFPILWVGGNNPAIYAWDGQGWTREDDDFYLEMAQFPERLTAADMRVWGTHHESLAYVDFGTDEKREIPLPSEVPARNLRLIGFRVNPNQSLLAWFSEKDMPTLLYRWQDGNWQKMAEFPRSDWRVWDYCQDFHGQVWALRDNEAGHQMQVGFLDEASGAWTWADFKLEQSDRALAYFKSMDVDFHGRIWVSGLYESINEENAKVEFVTALSWTNDALEPMIEYTELNSNLNYLDYFVMTRDRVWIAGGDLFWIDSEQLPSPLPDWIVRVRDTAWFDYYPLWALIAIAPLMAAAMYLELKS